MSDGKPSIVLPLFTVVGISAIKDIIEDLKRRKLDKSENLSKVLRADFLNKKFKEVTC
jgi:hypothetical protein